jgi:SAM-dependent methyltransferase
MYIFQPDRHLLKKQIQEFGHYVVGRTLDVGAGGFSRYEKFFNSSEYVKMDIGADDNLDVVGSADNIPLDDNSFDSVVSTQVFEHLRDPFKAATEIARVLKTGGVCLLTVPQWNELHEEPHDYYRYTKFGISEIFEKRGFETIVIDQRGGFFVTLFQIKVRYLLDRFHLHDHKFIGRIFSRLFKIGTSMALWLDKKDKSLANKKHAIGWLFVLRKK